MGGLSEKPALTAMIGLVVAVLFWAINAVVAKGVIFQVPPMSLSFYRWVTAMLFLIPFAWGPVKKDLPLIGQNLEKLFWLALPSVAVYNSVLYLGALYTTATNISLVVAAMPTAALGLAWAITGDRPRPLQILGIGMAMAGIITIHSFVSLLEPRRQSGGSAHGVGIYLPGAGICLGHGLVFSR